MDIHHDYQQCVTNSKFSAAYHNSGYWHLFFILSLVSFGRGNVFTIIKQFLSWAALESSFVITMHLCNIFSNQLSKNDLSRISYSLINAPLNYFSVGDVLLVLVLFGH